MTCDVAPSRSLWRLHSTGHSTVWRRYWYPANGLQPQILYQFARRRKRIPSCLSFFHARFSTFRFTSTLSYRSEKQKKTVERVSCCPQILNSLALNRNSDRLRYTRSGGGGREVNNLGSKRTFGHRPDDTINSCTRPALQLCMNGEGATKLTMAARYAYALGLQPSQRLAYPDLSCSSFAPFAESLSAVAGDTLPDDSISNEHEGGSMEPSPLPPTTIEDFEPFHSPRGYHIPKDKMKAAQGASAGSEASYWQYSMYSGPAPDYPSVTRHYCTSREQMEKVSQLFVGEELLGVDLEWKASASTTSGIKDNVSLIQIASEDRVALFHVAVFQGSDTEDFVAPTFQRLMESSDVVVTGVNIKGDATRLRKYLQIECEGVFELSYLYKLIKFHRGEWVPRNRRLISLAQQVEDHLRLPLKKGDVRTSDWTKKLDDQQFKYAASDAYAGVMLFHQMEAKRLELDPVPPRDSWATCCVVENVRSRVDATTVIVDEESDSTDVSFQSFETSESEMDEASISEDQSEASGSEVEDATDLLDQLGIEGESPGIEPEGSRNDATVAPEATVRKGTKSVVPPSQAYDKAQTWAAEYRLEHIGTQNTFAHLRAYHLWHHQQLDPSDITQVLRDPPLKKLTVMGYVCEAVYRGSLPADPHQLLQLCSIAPGPILPQHQGMHRAAVREVERRKKLSPEEAQEQHNVGWWKSR